MSDFDSRNEQILEAIINGTEYTDPPQSRIEDLLLQLKEVIEHGAGGEHHYSEDEQIVGTWIDGSTIYEKTVQFTTPSSSDYTRIATGITDADRVWVVTAFVANATQIAMFGTYFPAPNADQFVGLISNDDGIVTVDYRVGTNFQGGLTGFATLRYTKSS